MGEIELKLSEDEHRALSALSLRTGKREEELIHEAVERLIGHAGNSSMGIKQARGIWKDRDDLPDFVRIRKEWDRS